MTNNNAATMWPFGQNDPNSIFLGAMGDYDLSLTEPQLATTSDTNDADFEEVNFLFSPSNYLSLNSPQQTSNWNLFPSLPTPPMTFQLPNQVLPTLPQPGFVTEPLPESFVTPERPVVKRKASPVEQAHPKRLKKSTDAFPCEYPGCDQCYSRAGDLRKHVGRTHVPEDQRPLKCPKCTKRFFYSKDIRRHDVQVHQDKSSKTMATHALTRPSLQAGLSIDPKMLFQSHAPHIEHFADMISKIMSTRRFVLQLKIRRARRQSLSSDDNGRFVLITTDGRDFRAIDVSSAANAQDLNHAICKQMPIARGLALTQYMLGSGTIGASLNHESLLYEIFQRPASQGPLQLFLGSHAIKEEPATDNHPLS